MNDGGVQIEKARPEDVDAISRLIITTLFRSNAADYPQKVLERVAEVNAPARILANLEGREVLVARSPDGKLAGTAACEGDWIKSFFVHPDWQKRGVGQMLLRDVLAGMKNSGVEIAWLQSSLTAVAFYTASGFEAIREVIDDEDRTALMRLTISK